MDAVAQLLRWERSGGTWRVVRRSVAGTVTVALDTCHGEEMEQLTSDDAEFLALIDARTSSAD